MGMMEFQFQQRLGSSSANLGTVAHLFAGDFAGRRMFLPSKRTPKSKSSVAHTRNKPTGVVRLEFDEVVNRIKRGDQLTPQDAISAFNLGFAYRTLGRWLDSVEAFTTALEFMAKSDDKHREYNLATIHFMRGYSYGSLATKQKGGEARKNLESAKADYLKALNLKKDYMLVYCHLGVLYSVQRRWQEAERAFKKAIKLKPRYAGAHHDLAVTYMLSGRPKPALRAFEKAAVYEPKNILLLKHLAGAYYEAERWDDARRTLLRVLKLDPQDQDVLYKLGGAYLQLRSYQKAEKVLRKVLELDSSDPVAYGNLGLVYLRSGRLFESADAFNKALELRHPDEKTIRSSLNAVQLSMLMAVADACFDALSHQCHVDVDSLIDQVARIQVALFAKGTSPLSAPAAYFQNQLIGTFAPLVEYLNDESRFLMAAKLFERGLLSSGKASRLVGIPRVTFLLKLSKAGVAMIDLSPRELENEVRYANLE